MVSSCSQGLYDLGTGNKLDVEGEAVPATAEQVRVVVRNQAGCWVENKLSGTPMTGFTRALTTGELLHLSAPIVSELVRIVIQWAENGRNLISLPRWLSMKHRTPFTA